MNRLFFIVSCVLFLLVMVSAAFAQLETNTARLLEMSEIKAQEWALNRIEVEAYARQHNVPIHQELPDGTVIEIVRIEKDKPVYYMTENANAAITTRTNRLWITPFNLTGNGYNKLGIWDGDAVLLTHQEFSGRVTQEDGETNTSSHGTHVAGTMVATGVDVSAKGMAYEANLKAYDFTDDEIEMAAAAASGMEISNHSYGYTRGWYSGSWQGNSSVDPNEDYLFGFYDSNSRWWDEIAYNAPYYLIVMSAGNDRGDSGPGDPGEPEVDGGADGYDCLNQRKTCKNNLVVGAVDDVSNYTGPGSVSMSSFSNWGPADDGRIKPDVVANGIIVYSTNNTGDADYITKSGTSMASPNAAGTAALLQQHYQATHGGTPMRASTLKALMIHTADETGDNTGPDYKYGWGLVNAEAAAEVITEDIAVNVIDEIVLPDGGSYSQDITSAGSDPLRITVVWTDPPGTPPSPALNPRTPMLVNDLDLRLTKGGTTYYPWQLDYANPDNAATNSDENNIDNVEQVYVASPEAGTYTITVDHDGSLTNDSQAFSIIVSGAEDGILPVELADFHAQVVSEGIKLHWRTESEINNAGFYLYRNGQRVTPLIEGQGTTTTPHSYQYLDTAVEVGETYLYQISDVKEYTLEETFHFEISVIFDPPEYENDDEQQTEFAAPAHYQLHHNYPNPFNPVTMIGFDLVDAVHVTLNIYDTQGQLVKKLVDRQYASGTYDVEWDGTNENGDVVSSGVYFYTITTDNFELNETKAMILMK